MFQPANLFLKVQDNDTLRETKETWKQKLKWYFDREAWEVPILKSADRKCEESRFKCTRIGMVPSSA